MRVITLAGSPRYPSRSSALLEYARETLAAADIELSRAELAEIEQAMSGIEVVGNRY